MTGQYYLRARYYNPVIGRFTQEDTYRGDGLNLYAYCANNPVMYYDPSGHDTDACGNPTANDLGDPLAGQVSKEGGSNTWTSDQGIYTVAYEIELPSNMYPDVSDAKHFQEANKQLNEAFVKDPAFAQEMETLYPGIIDGVKPGPRDAYPRTAPTQDVTWHHEANRVGILQLVPTEQHTASGPIQSVLHPNGRGGMQNWGGGRRRKK